VLISHEKAKAKEGDILQEYKNSLYVPQKPLDIRGLSVLLGISVATLNRRKAEGKLPHHRIGARIVYTSKDIKP